MYLEILQLWAGMRGAHLVSHSHGAAKRRRCYKGYASSYAATVRPAAWLGAAIIAMIGVPVPVQHSQVGV